MVKKDAIEEFKKMSLEDIKEFLNADQQVSFADDSKVRLFCEQYYPFAYSHGISFAINAMYIDLSYALFEKLN